jgi:hypothetical protein
MSEVPRYLVPSESSTVPCSSREKVLGAPVVSHGELWFTGAGGGPGVAGRGGDEDACRRRRVEGERHRVGGGVVVSGDRVVEDVDAVEDRLFDRLDGGRAVAAAGARILVFPADLVDGHSRRGCHAGALAEVPAVHGDVDVGVSGRRGGGVGAVGVDVDRGDPLVGRTVRLRDGTDEVVGEVAGAEDLGVAGTAVEVLPGLALAQEGAAVGLEHGDLAVGGEIGLAHDGIALERLHLGAGQEGVLGAVAGVDDTDDRALARVGRAAELCRPESRPRPSASGSRRSSSRGYSARPG